MSRTVRSLRATLVGLVGAVWISACSSTTMQPADAGLIQRLKNRGPVALSSTNPYLAGNLLISREMDHNAEVQGFIKLRGAPAALEVEKGIFSSLLLTFYYPANRQFYTLEEADGGWVIAGPYTIDAERLRQINRLMRGHEGPPKLLDGSSAAPAPKLDESGAPAQEEDPFIARLKEQETKEFHGKFESPQNPVEGTSAPQVENPEAAAIDQIISETKSASVELSPKGDAVHYVTLSGETLSIISRWYTRDRQNAGKLSRINQLKDPNQLSIGDTVIIPSYLLKNTKRLTEAALKKLGNIAKGEESPALP